MSKLLTTKEICELFAVHPNTLLIWRKKEGLPYIEINKRVFMYDREKVQEWLDNKSKNKIDKE